MISELIQMCSISCLPLNHKLQLDQVHAFEQFLLAEGVWSRGASIYGACLVLEGELGIVTMNKVG